MYTSMGEKMVNDVEKLMKLMEHWKVHNLEHAETYKLWAEKMKILGRDELSQVIYEIHRRALEINELFEKALK